MAYVAQASGNGSLLWPEGCESVEDITWELSVVMQHAYRVLHWQENLLEEEMPPRWMWPFEEELQLWFERVDRERRSKYGGDSSSDDEEGGVMMGNELAKGRGRN